MKGVGAKFTCCFDLQDFSLTTPHWDATAVDWNLAAGRTSHRTRHSRSCHQDQTILKTRKSPHPLTKTDAVHASVMDGGNTCRGRSQFACRILPRWWWSFGCATKPTFKFTAIWRQQHFITVGQYQCKFLYRKMDLSVDRRGPYLYSPWATTVLTLGRGCPTRPTASSPF